MACIVAIPNERRVTRASGCAWRLGTSTFRATLPRVRFAARHLSPSFGNGINFYRSFGAERSAQDRDQWPRPEPTTTNRQIVVFDVRLSKVSYNFPSRHAANDFNLYYYFYTNVQPYLLAVYGSSRPRAVLKYVSLLKLFYTVRIRIARGGEYFAACYALKKVIVQMISRIAEVYHRLREWYYDWFRTGNFERQRPQWRIRTLSRPCSLKIHEMDAINVPNGT